jgi:hypothetical protein
MMGQIVPDVRERLLDLFYAIYRCVCVCFFGGGSCCSGCSLGSRLRCAAVSVHVHVLLELPPPPWVPRTWSRMLTCACTCTCTHARAGRTAAARSARWWSWV